jgi:acetoacetyl-CoA synthetase
VQANTAAFRDWLRQHRGLDLVDYPALRAWSVRDVSAFWASVWDYFDVQSPNPHKKVLAENVMPGARWFEGAQVNYARQVFRHAADPNKSTRPAIVFRSERLQREGRSVELSWTEVERRTASFAASLRAMGVARGDRVVAYLPNIPETAIAFLACASIGAVWSVCAPDMGVATVRDRFGQIEPKLLIACDGTVYGGKTVDRREVVASLLSALPTVEALVVVPYLESAGGARFDAASGFGGWNGRVAAWDECLAGDARLDPEWLPFDHPLWIVYSSGTTGLPKPIVHGHGGIMLEMLKLLAFHADLSPDDRYVWYSSSGWVMWNIQVSGLLLGTTICLYDGHPAHPVPDALWRFVGDVGATFFGAGAAYFTHCMKTGIEPRKSIDATKLRGLGSTGSPLPPDVYRWADTHVRPGIWWCVVAGGTDIASAFIAGTPEIPTIAGEMQGHALGADVQAWNDAGKPVIDEVGEMVCTQPMPSMPLRFWGDADNKRYRSSYFDTFPGVWRHGDWLRVTPSGNMVIYGRSDATLNRHGHRLGTSELYNVVEATPEIVDSLVVDLEFLGRPSYMPLFVVLAPGRTLDDALREEVRRRIREGVSPRFIPDEIVQVAEIPRTLTGKKQELPVKKLLLGKPLAEVVNKDATANPQALDWFVAFARNRAARLSRVAS